MIQRLNNDITAKKGINKVINIYNDLFSNINVIKAHSNKTVPKYLPIG